MKMQKHLSWKCILVIFHFAASSFATIKVNFKTCNACLEKMRIWNWPNVQNVSWSCIVVIFHLNSLLFAAIKVYFKASTLGCFRKTIFQENQKYNPLCISLGVSLRGSKIIFILTKFRGASGHFRFDLFYIVDFHSALTWPGWEWPEWKCTM